MIGFSMKTRTYFAVFDPQNLLKAPPIDNSGMFTFSHIAFYIQFSLDPGHAWSLVNLVHLFEALDGYLFDNRMEPWRVSTFFVFLFGDFVFAFFIYLFFRLVTCPLLLMTVKKC